MGRPKGIPHTEEWKQAHAQRMRGNSYSEGPKKWKVDDLPTAVQRSKSWTDLFIALGLKRSGGDQVRRWIVKLGLSTAHFTGEWQSQHKFSDAEVFCLNTSHPYAATRRFYSRTPDVCMLCGQTDVWNGQPLKLEIDHVNGNKKDCRWENLRKVCPNCHSQTDTYCGRNRTKAHGA